MPLFFKGLACLSTYNQKNYFFTELPIYCDKIIRSLVIKWLKIHTERQEKRNGNKESQTYREP